MPVISSILTNGKLSKDTSSKLSNQLSGRLAQALLHFTMNPAKSVANACMHKLKSFGWQLETRLDIATVVRPGPMDATFPVRDRLFCVEWETGNISSSHRAINKMALGILKKVLIGGALIVPTREMYHYLTDRVGNFREIQPYFPLWKALHVDEGLLIVIAIEHDAVSKDVPRIKKGTDGRALQ